MKPAGTETDEKAVAALVALNQTDLAYFQDIGALEASCVLQRGLIFRQKSTGNIYVSLGFVQFTALGWRLEPVKHGDATYYRFPSGHGMDLDKKIDCLQFLCNYGYKKYGDTEDTAEAYCGIPFEFCHLILESTFFLEMHIRFKLSD